MQISTAEYGLNRIYDEIFSSVSRIKQQQTEKTSTANGTLSASADKKPAPDISGLTVGYLSPEVAFSLQRFASSQPYPTASRQQNSNNNQYVEDEKSENKLTNNIQAIEKNSFIDDLQSYLPQYPTEHIAHMYQQTPTVSVNIGQTFALSARQTSQYAAEIYNMVFNINNSPTVKIGFLHPNNRSFDFRI